jgi:hypothetical protein
MRLCTLCRCYVTRPLQGLPAFLGGALFALTAMSE